MVIFQDVQCSNETVICARRADMAKKLLALTERNGYQIIQTNGQRVYAPSALINVPQPPKGCEVFIGKLHKNLFEDELIPLFESIGPLYKFRLMLDFTEQTRGYAFATYFKKEHAEKAVADLNGYQIRPKLRIGVYKSVDNCRLFIGNLPTDKTRLDVKELLNQYVSGVVEVIMYQDYANPRLNRGFVFVEFEDHRLAAMARRQFAPENLTAWGQTLYVDWADPLPEVDSRVMAKVSILYLKNLPLDYNTEEIYTIVCNIVGAGIVKRVHKMHNYAFVHISNRRFAEIAMRKLEGLLIGNRPVGIEWARPRCYSKKYRLNNAPDNFCTSVPPNLRRLVQKRLAECSFSSRASSTTTVTRSGSTYHQYNTYFSCQTLDVTTAETTIPSYGNFVNDIPQASSPFADRTFVSSEYSYFSGPHLFFNFYNPK